MENPFMPRAASARLSTKAQLVIPKSIRDRLGIGPGDRVLFVEREGEVVIRAVPREAGEDPFALFTEWSSEADERAYDDL
jgi:antitoxin PrlF